MTNYDSDVLWYYDTFPARLNEAAEHIQRNRNSYSWLHANFASFVELLRKSQSYLYRQVVEPVSCADAALELIALMGDWPRLWVNWIDSEQLLQFAVQLAETREKYDYQAEFLNRLAGIYTDTARKMLAVQTLDRAVDICQKYGLRLQLIKVTGTQIDLLIDQRELDEAERRLVEIETDPCPTYQSFEEQNEANGQLSMLRGWIQHQRGMLNEAQMNMAKAIEALRLAEKTHTMAHAYRLAGLIYNTSGDPHRAIKAIKRVQAKVVRQPVAE